MSKSKAFYICFGTPEAHLELLTECAESGEDVTWTINSKAKMGDRVLFYLKSPLSSLIASGVVLSNPEKNTDPDDKWEGYYESSIGSLKMLSHPIHISELRSKFPEWEWLKQPRRSARVPDSAVGKLQRLWVKPSKENAVIFPDVDEIDTHVKEGRRIVALHLRIERKPERVKAKKAQVLRQKGKLQCEVCKFDFEERYGVLGKGFCEVHHKIPLSQLDDETETRLEDLAVLCSNCHRMIHRPKSGTKPIMNIIQFKRMLRGKPSKLTEGDV